MSKWIMVFFFTFVTANFVFAQQKSLEIKGKGPDLYLDHTVAPRESFFSVGRLYNIAPKELAEFNHLKLASGLKVGQELRIPLGNGNFTQTGALGKGEVLVPLYHHVQSGETLYRLGVNYNKVPLASIKKWNHLSSDEVSLGQSMIVGYLKVGKNQSALASQKITPVNETAIIVPKEEQPVEKKTEAVRNDVPVAKAPDAAKTDNIKTIATSQVEENKTVVASVNNRSSINFSGGYFKNLYNQQASDKTQTDNNGVAGVFKSTSGWQDGKYYCFSNDATPGSVLKVTNVATGKSVYTKVLDAIPDIRQNSGLSIVISNAASEELGAGENRFDCVVSYAK